MKVLIINSVCGIGSTGKICTDIARVLLENGHECKIAYGRGSVPDKFKNISVKIGSDFVCDMSAIHTRITDKHGFSNRNSTKKFIKWVKDYNPDIIHLHNIHGYYINVDILFDYLKQSQKPVIWTLHDCWPFTGHCSYFDMCNCDKWKTHCSKCPQIKSYPKSFADRSYKNFEQKKNIFTGLEKMTIVTPSLWLKTVVKQSFLGCYDVEVIKNGIDMEIFKPTQGDFRKKYALENKKIILGVASVWDKRKGFEDFLKLSSMIDDDYAIVLVGLDKKQTESCPENIIGIERTGSATELAHIYTMADVFVNLTYEDNYPTVNIEAQACGTPVISYNTGGSVESITHSGVVGKGDVKGVWEKIKETSLDIRQDILIGKNEFACQYLKLYK